MSLESDIVLLRERNVTDGLLGDYLIRKIADEEDFQEVRYVLRGSKISFLQSSFLNSQSIVTFLSFQKNSIFHICVL